MNIRSVLILIAFGLISLNLQAATWSSTEIQLQYGDLDAPSFASGESVRTTIVTFQHASGWKYGSNFFFVDYLKDSKNDGFNDSTLYGEYYGSLSFSKLLDKQIGAGPIKDVELLFGLNMAPEAEVTKYLPGIRLSWDIKHFAFLNTDITAYLDDSAGVSGGGAPSEDNSYMIDVNFKLPFALGEKHQFSIEGHIEYIHERDNEFDSTVASWILAQPQLRYDLGNAVFTAKEQLYIGLEYQYWSNKLGDKATDESTVQLLLVWKL